ncbi:MAG: hypothetical protein ACKO1M_14385 [Planctomycetota bacterium]
MEVEPPPHLGEAAHPDPLVETVAAGEGRRGGGLVWRPFQLLVGARMVEPVHRLQRLDPTIEFAGDFRVLLGQFGSRQVDSFCEPILPVKQDVSEDPAAF